MPNLRTLSGIETIKALERLGFRQVRQRGSHIVLRKDTMQGAGGCTVPLHKELKIGTQEGFFAKVKLNQMIFKSIIIIK
ncbi:MAG: hypothetical protein A2315_01850 [Ignavibacteria bacterium RIFOXYB2_FULL_35_12]|nr:MAG: hypothetical protein A2058_01325 [Ignavibacteria bacterium GWA2_36_19]OGU54362.1 MAG: hypothetical protein A2006_09325 [Ignavibacteria bacterium GWC2_35_8]OGU62116.1 MAG: hypothetical protein A2X60_00440 [Ignavibacteria bacterium GWF2_35_20]OGU78502.1 MAG: hypothetical protein A2W11_05825 [Ignavibacteria bacterium RBG_16_35_7]OGU79744.1 MAG: hypothetical protein A2254_02355 [Ignavibacteria bacterium RIFOXYA2_FULL_35_9]OGU87694.1 MAG: hypothetical protein A3K31_06320 [Ignavibacteria bac